jgi:hypothetical protein
MRRIVFALADDYTRRGGLESTRQRYSPWWMIILDAVNRSRHGRGLYSDVAVGVDAVNV